MSTMHDHLFMEERRREILEQLQQSGRVLVKDLSEQLNVSTVTIRQDLRALEEEGLLERTHGGAVPRKRSSDQSELSFDIRRNKNVAEKDALGKAAAALVKSGYGIALDASTTVCSIIPYLKDIKNLTIVTNNLMVAHQLLDNPNVHVLLPGGRLRRDSYSVVGNPETLPDLNLNIGFVSAWGISLEEGLTEVSGEETAMKQALLAHCRMTVVLVDSSKWGQVAPYTYAQPNQVDRIITTDQVPAQFLEIFEEVNIPIEVITL